MILSERGATERPSHKELSAKIREARRLIQDGCWLPANASKLQANFEGLELEFEIETALPEDQAATLVAVLAEIGPDDYVGGRPPDPSYEQATRNQEMFAFRWTSGHFSDAIMYFKFSLCGTAEHRKLYIYSLHRNREEEEPE